jgi:hypothetical protein
MSKRKIHFNYDKMGKEAKANYPIFNLEYNKKNLGLSCKEIFIDKLSFELKGSTIIDVGFIPFMEGGFQEGGLTFDYMKDGVEKRIILGYTELGQWVEWCGEKL